MEKRELVAIFLFVSLLITGYLLFSDSQSSNIGFAVYNPNSFNLSFVSPTPDAGSYLSSSAVTINVTFAVNPVNCWLEWNNANESMTILGTNCFITKTGTGNVSFRVFANDSYGNFTYTDIRTATLNFTNTTDATENLALVSLNLTGISNLTFAEDNTTNVTVNLWNFTQSNKNLTLINYSVSSSNSSVLSCSLFSDRYVNCTPVQDKFGLIIVSLYANYSTVQATISFAVNITPVNDAPVFVANISTIYMRYTQNATVLLNTYFIDPDNSTLVYNFTPVQNITINVSGSTAYIYPNFGWLGNRTVNFSASDGQYTVYSNTFKINISAPNTTTETVPAANTDTTTLTLNIPEPSVTKFDSLSWNEGETFTLDLSKFFTDIGDNPVYSVSGLSNIAYTVLGNTVIFKSEAKWSGIETAIVKATTSKGEFSSEPFTITVLDSNKAPEIKKDIPALLFNETTKKVTLNLDDFFNDPDGDTLTYDVSQSKALNITRGSKNWIILSLAPNFKDVPTETITISAKDPEGKSVSDSVLITIAQSLREGFNFSEYWMQLLTLFLFVAVVVLGIKRYGGIKIPVGLAGRNRQYRPVEAPRPSVVHDHPTHLTDYDSMAVKKSSGSSSPFAFVNEGISWVKDAAGEKKTDPRIETELLYLRESISSVRALKTSTRDSLTKAALMREEEKLLKAMQSMMIRKDFKDMRKELLYLREVRAALREIREISTDKVVKEELGNTLRNLGDAVVELESHVETASNPLYNLPER